MDQYENSQKILIQRKYDIVRCLLSDSDSMFKYLNYDIVEHIQKMAIKAFDDSKVINYMGVYFDQRDNGIPSRINEKGDKFWEISGNDLHRANDLPAIVSRDGTLIWARYDYFHRMNDKPAFIGGDGAYEWLIDGALHRSYDLPAVILNDGTRMWYCNGDLHRRNNKPAIIYANGEVEYWEYGIEK
jgi:hypothetical protein